MPPQVPRSEAGCTCSRCRTGAFQTQLEEEFTRARAQRTACPRLQALVRSEPEEEGRKRLPGALVPTALRGSLKQPPRCVTELSELEQQDGVKRDSGVGSVSTYGNKHTEQSEIKDPRESPKRGTDNVTKPLHGILPSCSFDLNPSRGPGMSPVTLTQSCPRTSYILVFCKNTPYWRGV